VWVCRGASLAFDFLLSSLPQVFHEMDLDGSGEVTFGELLKLMYPYATPSELETMESWVAKEPEPEPEPEPELTAEQMKELRQMFNLYDKSKDGFISKSELLQAMQKTGLDKAEIGELFASADADGSNGINFDEFVALMESTGMYSRDR